MEEHRDKRLKADATDATAAPSDIAQSTPIDQKASNAKPAVNNHNAPKPKPKPVPILPPSIGDDISIWDNGVLLVDKPKTWTSYDVCGKLKGAMAALLGKKNRNIKVGHAGTLDPMATGLLIVCVGKGTKSINDFVEMRKEYSGTLRLGEGTASLDADSPVTETLPWDHLSDEDLQTAAKEKFMGVIEQTPPMFSAIKVDGKRLYEAAREGKEVERKSRSITIERFDLTRDENDRQNVNFYVTCTKGTYIRSLAHDLACSLGTTAHLVALRREAIGENRVTNAWDLLTLTSQIQELKKKRRESATAAVDTDVKRAE